MIIIRSPFSWYSKHNVHCTVEETDRRECKGCRCCLGDRIDSIHCRAGYFAPGRFEERDNSSYCSYHPGAIHPILHIVMVQNSYSVAKKLIDSAPPRSSDDLCILFCLYPFSIVINYSNCSLLQWLIFLGVYYGGREDSSEGEIQVWLKFKYRLPAIFAFH